MQNFFMMVGLPGSGKSTFARNVLSVSPGAVVHSSDEIRCELLGDENDQTQQALVFSTLHERVFSDLRAGKNVVYDATNINYKQRKQFVDRVRALRIRDLQITCVFMAVSYERCLQQNHERERSVPDSVITRMYHKFDVPMYLEGWDDIIVRGVEPSEDIINKTLVRLSALEHDNPHHQLTVGQHMLTAHNYFVSHYGDMAQDIVLSRSILLHDIGKEQTKAFHNSKGEPTEIAHFYNHERVGAYDSFACNYDLHMDDQLASALLIRWHMVPFAINHSDNPSKTEQKFKRMLGKDIWKRVKIINDCDLHAH